MTTSNSAGKNIDLRENKYATMRRTLTAEDAGYLDGKTPFFRLRPKGAAPIEVTCTVVDDRSFSFTFDCAAIPNNTPYECGWVDTEDFIEVIHYGVVVLV